MSVAQKFVEGLQDFAENMDKTTRFRRTTFQYAFFSLSAAKIFGVEHHQVNGHVVTYTGLSSYEDGSDYMWSDKKPVGIVPART